MVSGGARARSGPAPDPGSRRSLSKDRSWVTLPVSFDGGVPDWPFSDVSPEEEHLWSQIWLKPQAYMWDRLGLQWQVAAYIRALVISLAPRASADKKTAVLRMETELGLSVSGMKQNGWILQTDAETVASADLPPSAGRKTSSGDWLKAVAIEAP